MDWTHLAAPSLGAIETIAREEFARLPENFRSLCEGIAFSVAEFPADDVLDDVGIESEFDLLGLFQGPTLAERDAGLGAEPTMIFLYRRPILDAWAEGPQTLGDIVRNVLIHEIGHHFGLSDADMEKIENEN